MPPESDSIASSQQQNVNVPHTTVINSCLAFTKFLMSSRDKVYIREIITSKFDLDSLKKAYEVLYKFCEPDIKFTFQGPRKMLVYVTNVYMSLISFMENYVSSMPRQSPR